MDITGLYVIFNYLDKNVLVCTSYDMYVANAWRIVSCIVPKNKVSIQCHESKLQLTRCDCGITIRKSAFSKCQHVFVLRDRCFCPAIGVIPGTMYLYYLYSTYFHGNYHSCMSDIQI